MPMMIDADILIAIVAFSMTIFIAIKAVEAYGEGWTAGKAVVLAFTGAITAYMYILSWDTIVQLFQSLL